MTTVVTLIKATNMDFVMTWTIAMVTNNAIIMTMFKTWTLTLIMTIATNSAVIMALDVLTIYDYSYAYRYC